MARLLKGSALLLLVFAVFVTGAWAQTTKTEVKSGEVVYVSGNDVVVKMSDGTIKNFVVPNDATFTMDGKTMTLKDLKPGIKLQQTITTTETPQTVKTVRTIKGKVWYASGNNVILTLDSGENKQYKVPDGTVFVIDGEKKTVFDLRKGMNVSATVVSTSESTVVSETKSTTGQAPPTAAAAAPAPKPVPLVGVLLIEVPSAPPNPPASAGPPPTPDPKPASLPKTASSLPTLALVGALLLVASGAFGLIRRMS
jgi:LPXTG-motif cell wall-anchored protein